MPPRSLAWWRSLAARSRKRDGRRPRHRRPGDGRGRRRRRPSRARGPAPALPFFFSSRRRHTRSVSAFLLNRSSDLPLQQLNGLETLVIIMVANKYAFLQITRRRFLNEWEAFKKVISRRNIRRRITIPLTLSNLKLLRRITRTENILHRNFTRRQ